MIIKIIGEFARFAGQFKLIRANVHVKVIRAKLPDLPANIKLSGRNCLLISGYVFWKPINLNYLMIKVGLFNLFILIGV
jgi:hypothetical protein